MLFQYPIAPVGSAFGPPAGLFFPGGYAMDEPTVKRTIAYVDSFLYGGCQIPRLIPCVAVFGMQTCRHGGERCSDVLPTAEIFESTCLATQWGGTTASVGREKGIDIRLALDIVRISRDAVSEKERTRISPCPLRFLSEPNERLNGESRRCYLPAGLISKWCALGMRAALICASKSAICLSSAASCSGLPLLSWTLRQRLK